MAATFEINGVKIKQPRNRAQVEAPKKIKKHAVKYILTFPKRERITKILKVLATLIKTNKRPLPKFKTFRAEISFV